MSVRTVAISVPGFGAGADAVAAATLARDDAGGAVELLLLDEGGEDEFEERVRENAAHAIADPAVFAYLGDFRSPATAVSLPLLERAGLAQVSFCNTYRNLFGLSYFNLIADDERLALAMADWMLECSVRRPFLIDAGPYGADLRWLVHRALASRGVAVGGAAHCHGPHHLPKIDREADALFLGAAARDVPAHLVERIAAAVPDVPIFAPDGMGYPEIARDLAQPVAVRLRVGQGAAPARALSPAAVEVERRLQARVGHAPDLHALYAYEGMRLLAEVIPGADDRRDVIGRLRAIERRESILGPYRFAPDGRTTLQTTGRLRIEDRRFVPDQSVFSPRKLATGLALKLPIDA